MEKYDVSNAIFDESIKCDKAVAVLEAITIQYQSFSDMAKAEDFIRLINYAYIALDYMKEIQIDLNSISSKIVEIKETKAA